MPKPGQSKKHGSGVLDSVENALGWVLTENAKLSFFHSESSVEAGNEVILSTKQMGRPGGSAVNLTRMTEEELIATKKLIDRAFDVAMPVVQLRDKVANDAYEQGDDTHLRIYRAVPQLVYREGAITEYSESLCGRLEDLSGGDGLGEPESNGD